LKTPTLRIDWWKGRYIEREHRSFQKYSQRSSEYNSFFLHHPNITPKKEESARASSLHQYFVGRRAEGELEKGGIVENISQ